MSDLTLPAFANANEVLEPTTYHEDMREEMIEEMNTYGEYG